MADAGNSGDAGCGGLYDGVGCVHGFVTFLGSKVVEVME